MATPQEQQKAASQQREKREMDKIKALPKKPAQLIETRLGLAEYKRHHWVANPSPGVSIEQVSNPLYFAHVAGKLGPGARIDVLPDDFSYFAELLVVRTEKEAAHVVVLRHVPLQHGDLAGEEDLGDYEIAYAGDSAKWRAIRKADGAVMVSGLNSRDAVSTWLRAETQKKTA